MNEARIFSGGDSDKGFVIKVNGVSITFAAGGRDSDSVVQTKTVVPYSMDKDGNAIIDPAYVNEARIYPAYSVKAREDDKNTDTNEKNKTSGNH